MCSSYPTLVGGSGQSANYPESTERKHTYKQDDKDLDQPEELSEVESSDASDFDVQEAILQEALLSRHVQMTTEENEIVSLNVPSIQRSEQLAELAT